MNAVEATLLTDTLVGGQLYLPPPSQNPVFLNSHKNSVFLHSRKRPAPVEDTWRWPGDVRLRDFHSIQILRG